MIARLHLVCLLLIIHTYVRVTTDTDNTYIPIAKYITLAST